MYPWSPCVSLRSFECDKSHVDLPEKSPESIRNSAKQGPKDP